MLREPNVAPCPVCAGSGAWEQQSGKPWDGKSNGTRQKCMWCGGNGLVYADSKLPLDSDPPKP